MRDCVCGGSTSIPNPDCERCQMVKVIGQLREESEAAQSKVTRLLVRMKLAKEYLNED